MKKSRILAAAMASIALTGALASCGKEDEKIESENNVNVCVYGPPSVFSDEAGDNTADGQEFFTESTAEDGQTATSQGD